MLPTANKPMPTPTRNDGYQVLNVSNVNAQNEVVLNDEMLLALIQQYPFLYNPHVRPHNDPDYDAWAWEQITKAFNRTYENLNRNVWYATPELVNRWRTLQPIVRSLSKINNIKSLPDTLRQTVVKMSVPMEEKPNDAHKKPLSAAQKVLLSYEPLVKTLSLEERRRLEAEMMELILNSELNSKATIKIGQPELLTIEKECNEFLNALGLGDIYLDVQNNENYQINQSSKPNDINSNGTAFLAQNDMNNTNPSAECNNNGRKSEESFSSEITLQATESLSPLLANEAENIFGANEIESTFLTNKIESPFQENEIESPFRANEIESTFQTVENISTLQQPDETEENLLEPLADKRYIPLAHWHHYVRKCRVRLKRCRMEEDDLPLAAIKREKWD